MFLRKTKLDREPLTVTMTGVKLGERALQIGGGDARAIASIAAKTGLTGTAAIVVADERSAAAIRAAIDDVGAVVDLRVVADLSLPFDDASFDVIVVHGADELTRTGSSSARWLDACRRLLRSGGRIVAIESGTAVGLRALLGGRPGAREGTGAGTVEQLRGAGFQTVRVLADREGLRFIEGFKTQ